ncbi:DegT/DnrJ/EryC1/StrS family aminotransferase [Chloroflexi bacterium TSY]|nr:DegT/DnrJ/EryC1/StrS family aminotransferase [Chloroflexi bacterium TSY]
MSEIISVPLLDLRAQYATIRDDVQEAMNRVVDSQYFILGPEVEALEKEVADYSSCQYGIGVSSGTDALIVALMAIDIQPDDEVITTPFSFFATAGSIARLGAKPVFVDIDPVTFNIVPDAIEAAITERTRAIIPVHLFGQMAEMNPIMEIAKRHNLIVIEDAAQSIGAEYYGRRAGSIGHMGCFSFFPSKNLGAFGDGGMIVTNDAAFAERLDMLRKHGSHPKYYHKYVGGNFRLDALQAAVLRVKLPLLDSWSERRQRNAERYGQLFEDTSLTEVELPVKVPNRRHIYNQFVIRGPRRNELMAHLKANNIGCEIYYPVSLHQQECFAYLGYQADDFPASERAADETLALPVYPEMTEEMQHAVVQRVVEFYEGVPY